MTHPSESPITKCLRRIIGTIHNDSADSELIERYLATGDSSAFELFVWRHYATVLRSCRAVLRDHHAAEDAAQATFLVFARKAAVIRDRKGAVGWLHTTAYRISIRAAVARKKRRFDTLVESSTPLQEEHLDDAAVSLHEELVRLPSRLRVPLILCYFEGLSNSDAANRLGISLGSLKSCIAQAKQLLQKRLSKRGIAESTFAALTVVISPSVVSAGRISEVARFAIQFVREGCCEGASPLSLELAQGTLRTMARNKICTIVASVALLVVGSTGVVAATIFPSSPPKFAVVAPQNAGAATQDHAGIDRETVEAYERSGATYGGFVNDPFSLEPKFLPGKDAARTGLPGFSWYKEPLDADQLPEPRCRYGIEFRAEVPNEILNKFPVSDRLETLISHSKCSTDQTVGLLVARYGAVHNLVLGNSAITAGCLEEIKKLKRLESLSLNLILREGPVAPDRRRKVALVDTNAQMALLSELKTLRSLSLTAPLLTEKVAQQFPKMASLENLSLNVGKFHNDPQVIYELKQLKELKRLFLTLAHDTTRNLRLADLVCLKHPVAIGIDYDGLTDGDVAALAKLNTENLKTLKIHGGTDLTAEAFASVAKMRNLSSVSYSATSVLAGDAIRTLSEMPALEQVAIVSSRWNTSARQTLCLLGEHVQTLDLLCPEMNDETLRSLSALTNLQSLTLRGGSITNKGVSQLIAFKKLQSLTLPGNLLKDEAVNIIAELKGLRHLNINDAPISDAALEKLSALSSLVTLDVRSNQLTKNAIDSFEKFDSLRVLTVEGEIFNAQLESFHKRLPHCEVRIVDISSSDR